MVETMILKISVLVPTIGARKVELIRLFESIIEQNYAQLEVVLVVQDNFESMRELCDSYSEKLDIVYVPTDKKGLSRARNIGLQHLTGDIVLLSDDDCWYENNGINSILNFFNENDNVDVLLTQIYDPVSDVPYKHYPENSEQLTKPIELLSKSSIEIAFRRREPILDFDELFGLGGMYVAGEENDFLIRSLKKGKIIQYEPIVTVYHEKKQQKESNKQLIAKGAFYSKNFGFLISNLVLLRDLLIKHQNNYRWFWNGYFDYKKQNKGIH